MANLLSSAQRETLVSSFLEVAVGQSVEIAHHYLKATNWNIEDALQLFYVGDARHIAISLSYVPSVGYTPLSSDHNHSGLEEHIWNVNATQNVGGDLQPPLPVIKAVPAALLFGTASTTNVSTPTTRRKRRTSAEIAAAAQTSTTDFLIPVIPEKATRQKRRLHTEEQASSEVIPLHNSSDLATLSRCTATAPTDSTHFRQLKRLKGLQENCHVQEMGRHQYIRDILEHRLPVN